MSKKGTRKGYTYDDLDAMAFGASVLDAVAQEAAARTELGILLDGARARIRVLEAALGKLHETGKIAVNQMICLGGDDACGPCKDREQLAVALEAARIALDDTEPPERK